MTWRIGGILLVVLVLGMAAASSAGATTRALEPAMERYGECRAPAAAHVAGGISSAYRGQVVQVVMMSNGAQLIVRYGKRHHDATWITRHGSADRLFTFRHLFNVPRILGELCN